ncbi:MAG: hypothetical protein AAFS07_03205 [Pseudomonadota bacterium]
MRYEYRVIASPQRGIKRRGVKAGADRLALALEEVLAAQAAEGWEFQRAEVLPVLESAGTFGGSKEMTRAVLVFRRPVEQPAPEGRMTYTDAPAPTEAQQPLFAAPRPAAEPAFRAMTEPAPVLRREPAFPTTPSPAATEDYGFPRYPGIDDEPLPLADPVPAPAQDAPPQGGAPAPAQPRPQSRPRPSTGLYTGSRPRGGAEDPAVAMPTRPEPAETAAPPPAQPPAPPPAEPPEETRDLGDIRDALRRLDR